MLGPLAQLRGEKWGQNSGKRAERGGIGAARRVAHQIGLVPKLDRQRKQRAEREIDSGCRGVAAKTAQQVVLGDTELRVFAKFFTQVLGRRIEEMRRPLGEV